MLRVGIIGFGAIGQALHRAIAAGRAGAAACPAVLVRRERPAMGSAMGAPLTADPQRFFAQGFDAVLECAGHAAVREHGAAALRAGADLLVTSVGALTDAALYARLEAAARESGRRLVIPSAGIGALDILGAAAVGGLERVTVTVRKDPLSWKGTLAEREHDLDRLPGPVTLFRGPVRQGAPLYPGNVNISAAVGLAGLGLDATELHIVADPTIATHVVEIEAAGAFGRFHFVEDVLPSAENPKTGRIVAMALIKTVRQMSAPVVFGG